MGGVVEVVVPFGGVEPRRPPSASRSCRRVMLRSSSVVEMHVPVRRCGCARLRRAPPGAAPRTGRVDVVDGVEAQPVEAVFLQPVEGVLDEEVAHRPLLVGDGAAPGRLRARDGRSPARRGAGSSRPGRSGCRRRRGTPSARARAPRRRGASALPARHRRCAARRAARRHSPSRGRRRTAPPA